MTELVKVGSVLDKLCFMLDLDYDKSGDNYLIHK